MYCVLLSERASLLENSAYVLIVAGGVVFGIAFLGFCGACKSKKPFLYGVSETSRRHIITADMILLCSSTCSKHLPPKEPAACGVLRMRRHSPVTSLSVSGLCCSTPSWWRSFCCWRSALVSWPTATKTMYVSTACRAHLFLHFCVYLLRFCAHMLTLPKPPTPSPNTSMNIGF